MKSEEFAAANQLGSIEGTPAGISSLFTIYS